MLADTQQKITWETLQENVSEEESPSQRVVCKKYLQALAKDSWRKKRQEEILELDEQIRNAVYRYDKSFCLPMRRTADIEYLPLHMETIEVPMWIARELWHPRSFLTYEHPSLIKIQTTEWALVQMFKDACSYFRIKKTDDISPLHIMIAYRTYTIEYERSPYYGLCSPSRIRMT